jgi:hypothetical protein
LTHWAHEVPQPPSGAPAQFNFESMKVAQVPVVGAPTCCITSGGAAPEVTLTEIVKASGVWIRLTPTIVNVSVPGPVIVNVVGSCVEMLPDEGDIAPGVLENDQPVQGMMFTPTEPAATIRFGNVTVKVSPM